jgi:hypothetical protein
MTTPRIRLVGDTIEVGRVSITFQRTLRIPDDGRSYPLPPGLGAFPIRRVKDFVHRVPASWKERGGYFIPMYQREALWIAFHGAHWRPNAVKVGIGGINAISGGKWDERLRGRPQDYLVVPDQPWLDGINAGRNLVRQFVAMPLGQGFTVEGQITGIEDEGGVQLTVFEPKPGKFPARPLNSFGRRSQLLVMACEASVPLMEMGLAAGGQMVQKIYPDQHGIDTWDPVRKATVHVHIVNSEMYNTITGEPTPWTPISARTYTEYGLPWFQLYDEHRSDVAAPKILKGVKSITAIENGAGAGRASTKGGLIVKKSQVLVIKK